MKRPEPRALGLSYDGLSAPTLDFKVSGEEARQLLAAAREAGVMVHEDEALLAMLERLEAGAEIPPQLYVIIAELIAFAWYLQGKTPPHWRDGDGHHARV
ncbi:EscU/YscU/HrcU family type III secretion system export apparatus switch protein [Gallaecimonas sp. GXIMD4217]|uniref:EscU/YscU/HrcU family type III secretion system export apparatus switch protein n=1 Tax=Gallaecimonas sp. GXIMD4217 TaxID=3131927 RepID=UPI00311B3F87